jgi:hypothetical protein
MLGKGDLMNYVHVEFEEVKRITEKAILFIFEDGEAVWIPISQIASEDVGQYKVGKYEGSVSITEFIAREKGLML